MSDGYKVYASQEYVDDKTSEKNYKTINGQSILGEGDISTGEKWELLQETTDIEVRQISQDFKEEYIRYAIEVWGVAIDAGTSWKLILNNNNNAMTYLGATIPAHQYGGGTWLFIETPKNDAPPLFWGSTSTNGGNGATALKMSFVSPTHSNLKSFQLIPNNSEVEYTSLSVKIWGIKA